MAQKNSSFPFGAVLIELYYKELRLTFRSPVAFPITLAKRVQKERERFVRAVHG